MDGFHGRHIQGDVIIDNLLCDFLGETHVVVLCIVYYINKSILFSKKKYPMLQNQIHINRAFLSADWSKRRNRLGLP